MPRRIKLLALGLAALCFLSGCAEQRRPLVLAAASLEPWVRSSEAQLRSLDFSFGGSHTLVEQARRGAPADLLLLADLPRTELPGFAPPRPFASNQLVLVARGRPCSLSDLERGRVAMGDPERAPVGSYGKSALQKLGKWESVQARLTLTRDDGAALLLLRTGHVDLAVAYASDLVGRPELGPGCPLPSPRRVLYYSMARQPARRGIVTFLEWLDEPAGLESLRAAGLQPPQ